jgi:hypothetical protein
MRYVCWECKRLWQRYCITALEEFASQERLAAAARMNDEEGMFRLRIALESAAANAGLVREDIEAHRKKHTKTMSTAC